MTTNRAILWFLPFLLCSCNASAQKEPSEEQKARNAKARSLFAEACKRSGEFIHRTVANVEGLMLLRLRPTEFSPYDQNAIDPYGYDFDWKNKDKPPPYISTFLVGKNKNGHFRETHVQEPIVLSGYSYVEAIDPYDGKRYRYTGSIKVIGRKNPNTPNHLVELARDPNFDLNNYDFVLDRAPAPGPMPRYGVTYDDISTREERDYWIAGSSMKVIDLQTNEVIAERIGYLIDFAQGATPGGRQPWTFAMKNDGWSCPALKGQSYRARRFVEKVLLIHPAQIVIPPTSSWQAGPVK